MVIVETPDAVLVSPRERVQDVKAVVDRLKEAERPEVTTPADAARPWGREQQLTAGPQATVRRLVIDPGGELVLQPNASFAEEWVVVAGSALVTTDGVGQNVEAGQHVSLAAGLDHRIVNPGATALEVIAVKVGRPAEAGA